MICEGGEVFEDGVGVVFAAEFAEREAAVVAERAVGGDGHVGEVAGFGGGFEEVFLRIFGAAECFVGVADPVVDVGFGLEVVVCFAERFGGVHGTGEVAQGGFGVAGFEGGAAEAEVSLGELAEDGAFAAFPWVEAAGGDDFQGFGRVAGEVVEAGEGDGAVVALEDAVELAFEVGEAFC